MGGTRQTARLEGAPQATVWRVTDPRRLGPAPSACLARATGSDPCGRAGDSDGGGPGGRTLCRAETSASGFRTKDSSRRLWNQSWVSAGQGAPRARARRARASLAWTGFGGGEQLAHYETPSAGQCFLVAARKSQRRGWVSVGGE